MTVVRLLLLVLGLSHLRGCFTPLCDAVGGYESQVISTRTGDKVMTGAAGTSGGDLILDMAMYSLPPRYDHTAVRMDETYGPQELAKFELTNDYGSGVIASGESWWYSVAGQRDDHSSGVFFVTPEVTFVDAGEIFTGEWLPFDEPEPHGLLVGDNRDGLRAIEITPGGVRREWSLPSENVWAIGARDAERLPGGAIALVSFRHQRGALVLHLLGEGEPAEVPLRENLTHVRLTTALASNGMLAVVLESKAGELEVVVFDPRNPGQLEWQLLTSKDAPGRFARVVADGEKFIAAWFAPEGHELRARTFTAARLGPAATIAPLVRRGNRLPSIEIVPKGEEVLFVWQEDEVMSRRVPAEFAGLAFLERLCALF